MDNRLDYAELAPAAVTALGRLEAHVRHSGLEHTLLELVKTRASQLNGCAYCLDMHTKDARAAGETEQRLHVLAAWREAPFYTDRERAALEWTEEVTLIAERNVPDELYARMLDHFTEKELADLTFAIIGINAWNRLAVSFRVPAGTYEPAS